MNHQASPKKRLGNFTIKKDMATIFGSRYGVLQIRIENEGKWYNILFEVIDCEKMYTFNYNSYYVF
jgi:hypothetical protein